MSGILLWRVDGVGGRGWQQGGTDKSGKGRGKKTTIGLKTRILPKALTIREKDRSWSADYLN